MTSVALVSIGGAPGVSTLVAAMATTATADTPLLVVEAAPAGGVVASRWGWPRHGTIAELAMDLTGGTNLWQAARPWIDTSRIVPADPSPVVMRQAQVGRWLAEAVPAATQPLVVDAGRLDGSADQLALLTAVDHRWVLCEPCVEQVVAGRAVSGWLQRAGPVDLLVREPGRATGRYGDGEVAATLGWPSLASVPHDRHAADALTGVAPARRDLRRSPLVRTARDLTGRLATTGVAAS